MAQNSLNTGKHVTFNGLFSSTPPSVDHDNSPPPFEFKPIEITSICKQLKGLKTKKAIGLDNIPNRLLNWQPTV